MNAFLHALLFLAFDFPTIALSFFDQASCSSDERGAASDPFYLDYHTLSHSFATYPDTI